MKKYRLFEPFGGNKWIIRVNDDPGVTTYIPYAEENEDYQEYLRWLAEGNEPDPPGEEAEQKI